MQTFYINRPCDSTRELNRLLRGRSSNHYISQLLCILQRCKRKKTVNINCLDFSSFT